MLKNLLKKIFTVSMVGIMVFSMVSCGSNKSNKSNQVEKIKESGKLVLGTCADYPPYEFHKVVDGEDKIIGFDVDIAREIANDMGVELEIKDMDFKGLLAALDSNSVDMVLAGMNPTPERIKNKDFSNIYYTAVHGIIVRENDKNKIKNIDDLSGHKIGVQKGTVQEELANEQIKGAEVKSLGKLTDLVLELKNKKIDAIICEVPVAQFYVNNNKDLSLTDLKLEVKDGEQGSAIAFKKGSKELVDEANKVLDNLKETGKIDKFVVESNKQVE